LPTQNKTSDNYITGLDIFRFVGAIGVIFIHSFMEYQHVFDAYGVRMLTRWIVPFFLVVTGYFLKREFKPFCKYIFHILILYIFWTVFYALVFHYDIYSVRKFLSALRSGLVIHLWYFPTLLMCSIFVWILIRILRKPSWVIAVCSVLFVFAIIGHTLINVPAFDVINQSFLRTLHVRIIGETTTRDGICWASLYIAIGYAIRQNNERPLFKIKSYPKFWLIFTAVVVIATLETWAVVYYNPGEKDILISTIPLVIMIFTLGLNMKMPKKVGEFLRSTGNATFVMHYFYLNILMQAGLMSWALFLLTTLLTVGTAAALTYFAGKYPKLHYII